MSRFPIRVLAAALTASGLYISAPVRAADTIRIIVPFAAGGPVDAMARILAQEMQAPLDANIVVENRGGGGGVIGTEIVARAPPDGKTLLVGSQGSHVVSGLLQPHVSYDPAKSFEPIGMAGSVPLLLIANPGLPVTNFKELVALAKTRKLSYASAGAGSVMNIAGELMNLGAGISTTHIPYSGVAPALNDLIAGHVDLIPADPPVLLPHVQNKSVRALALFGTKRLASLPDIPTTVELGYSDMIIENWYGVIAPAGIPEDVADRLEKAFLIAVNTPLVQQHMKIGELTGTLNRREFKARVEHDVAYWRPTLKKLGISVQGNAP
jgi:tripartite-type tricarboxylate transporter receptor subunit TctC